MTTFLKLKRDSEWRGKKTLGGNIEEHVGDYVYSVCDRVNSVVILDCKQR